MESKSMRLLIKKMSIVNNGLEGGKYGLHPQIRRKIGRVNDGAYYLDLGCTIRSTAENPFPADVEAVIRGIFTFESGTDEEEINQYLSYEAVDLLFPYLRSAITSLSTDALLPPIFIPVATARQLFDEKRKLYS